MPSNHSELPSGPVLPMDQMRGGETGEIAKVVGGRGMKRRLTELGFSPGVPVRLIKGSFRSGPIMVKVGEAKIAIGRGMARRVFVRSRPIDDG